MSEFSSILNLRLLEEDCILGISFFSFQRAVDGWTAHTLVGNEHYGIATA